MIKQLVGLVQAEQTTHTVVTVVVPDSDTTPTNVNNPATVDSSVREHETVDDEQELIEAQQYVSVPKSYNRQMREIEEIAAAATITKGIGVRVTRSVVFPAMLQTPAPLTTTATTVQKVTAVVAAEGEVFDVERIIGRRVNSARKKGPQVQYLIAWKGYSEAYVINFCMHYGTHCMP